MTRLSCGLLLVLVAPLLARADDAAKAMSTYDVVFIGDSITAGDYLADAARNAPPGVAGQDLQNMLGANAAVYVSNQGHSGHTTVDFLPGGNDFAGVEAAAKQLEASHPGQVVFSLMLGTNDSANSGPKGAPVTAEDYAHNLKQIIDKLLGDFPDCKVVLNCPIWYSPNTHNGADYEGNSAANRLRSYFTAIDSIVAAYEPAPPNHVFVGDTLGYNYFSIHFESEMKGENGVNGTFFLDPNLTGAQTLGKFWASAIFKILKPG
jgi:lysophospholipase L1-like esterase